MRLERMCPHMKAKMNKFSDLGLTEAILRALDAEGYTQPTPIQAKAIPVVLDNRDMVGIAQTGTGKTAAFVLPILHQIINGLYRPSRGCCGALILAPTRELAMQIHESVQTYSRFVSVTTALLIGGVKPHKQIKSIARGVDIMIATPGRLEDLEASEALSLEETKIVVLDEADQMLDMGFIPAIRRIMSKLPRQRQTVLLSATMPKQIRHLAKDFLKNPVEVSVAPASKPIDRIDQIVLPVAKAEKRQKLVEILHNQDVKRAIVFTRTKHGANKLARHLEQAGLAADAIHGNKSQGQRQRALEGFKTGDIPVLVATDIAARGIDVDGVSHVVNFELPNVPEVYVHRIGRTARAGTEGVAISFCDAEERDLLRAIEKLIGRRFDAMPETEQSTSATPTKGPKRAAANRQGKRRGRPAGEGGRSASGSASHKARSRRRPGESAGNDNRRKSSTSKSRNQSGRRWA